MLMNTAEYLSIIENIKSEITAAQYRAAVHVNADMLLLYYDIGCIINEHKSWGNKFIDNLAADKVADMAERKWYIKKSAENGWNGILSRYLFGMSQSFFWSLEQGLLFWEISIT